MTGKHEGKETHYLERDSRTFGFTAEQARKKPTNIKAHFATIGGTLLPEATSESGWRTSFHELSVFQSIFINDIASFFYFF